MADTTPSSPDIAHAGPGGEAEVPDDVPLVFALQAPAAASAVDRATWGFHREGVSVESDTPPPSEGLRVLTETGVPRISAGDRGAQSADEASSGLPSPDPSSPGLHTPMDSPPASHVLSIKDDVPDIRHLFINDRAPAPSQSSQSEFVGTRDTTIGTVSTRRGEGVNMTPNMTSQLYHLSVAIRDNEDDDKSAETYKLFIDTGSNDTFGFGRPLFEIATRDPRGNMDRERRSPWSQTHISSAPSHSFLPHEFDPSLSNRELEERGFIIGRICYADGALAHLGLVEPRSWFLYCFDAKRQQSFEIRLTWRFGVAFAVNRRLFFDPTSGMLGLGLTGIQHAYKLANDAPGSFTPPSFLVALKSKLKSMPASRTREDVAMFFCLRLAPECYPNGRPRGKPIQSWMSFNVWPCNDEPAWNTAEIIVSNSKPDRRQWAVYLRSIQFARIDASLRRPVPIDSSACRYLKDTSLNFVDSRRPKGLLVHLDTGTSVTYLPLADVQRMNKNLFMNEDPVVLPGPGEQPRTYKVDPNSWIFDPTSPSKIQVIYEFEGKEGSDPVFVSGPFETFAYQQNPFHPRRFEGLIFPSEDPSSTNTGTLGLNFFQTMYVSLHKSSYYLDFVRMAGQWPENLASDLEKYYVAGV